MMSDYECNHNLVVNDICHDCGERIALPLTNSDFLGPKPMQGLETGERPIMTDHNQQSGGGGETLYECERCGETAVAITHEGYIEHWTCESCGHHYTWRAFGLSKPTPPLTDGAETQGCNERD